MACFHKSTWHALDRLFTKISCAYDFKTGKKYDETCNDRVVVRITIVLTAQNGVRGQSLIKYNT